jgi:hypothetical protein
MNMVIRELGKHIINRALVLFVVISLLMPGSFSVLCIAPGSHVAIEDINALCCISPHIAYPSSTQPNSAFDQPVNCSHCTDLLLISHESGVLLQSGISTAANPFDADFLSASFSADLANAISQSIENGSLASPIPVCLSISLRC